MQFRGTQTVYISWSCKPQSKYDVIQCVGFRVGRWSYYYNSCVKCDLRLVEDSNEKSGTVRTVVLGVHRDDDGCVVRGHGGLLPESPLAHVTTLTWPLLFGALEVTIHVFTRSLSLSIMRKGTVYSAAAMDSMTREEHRHLLWAFNCINNKTQGYLVFFDRAQQIVEMS